MQTSIQEYNAYSIPVCGWIKEASRVYIRLNRSALGFNWICTTLRGRIKGKAGIHLKYYPENRDTFEMYPGKAMHIIGG